jgi:hypothetical protein
MTTAQIKEASTNKKVGIVYWENGQETKIRIGDKYYTYWGIDQDEKERLESWIKNSNYQKIFSFLKNHRVMSYVNEVKEIQLELGIKE